MGYTRLMVRSTAQVSNSFTKSLARMLTLGIALVCVTACGPLSHTVKLSMVPEASRAEVEPLKVAADQAKSDHDAAVTHRRRVRLREPRRDPARLVPREDLAVARRLVAVLRADRAHAERERMTERDRVIRSESACPRQPRERGDEGESGTPEPQRVHQQHEDGYRSGVLTDYGEPA